MTGRLIVIEGVDAVGKTTLAKGLAQSLNGVYYKTPGSRTPQEREVYDREGVSVEERFRFYLEACREDISRIMDIQAEGKDVVCDRLLASTVIGHKTLVSTLDVSEAEELSSKIKKKQILLIAPIDTIRNRLSKREETTRFERDDNFLISMQSGFLQLQHDLIVSTDIVGVQEVLDRANRFIKQVYE